MNLPNISTPIHEVKLISQKDPVKFRPFLVKEQKLMLMANEAKDDKETANTIKQIAKNCIVTEGIDVDDLPLVDIELLFLNFRARSVGEMINAMFRCRNTRDDNGGAECGMTVEVPINLLEIPVVNLDVNRKIMITDKVGVQMKYPTFDVASTLLQSKESRDPDVEFKAVAMNIDYIFDDNGIYYAKDASQEELLNFIYSMPPDKYKEIEAFFDQMPTTKIEIDKKCPRCSYEHHFVLEGINDFFT
jgi:T4 bacteriophage base plate protein